MPSTKNTSFEEQGRLPTEMENTGAAQIVLLFKGMEGAL